MLVNRNPGWKMRPGVWLACIVIRVYQLTFSAFIGRTCRYMPSCSVYADEVIRKYGLWIGLWMALARLSRCHPWGSHGIDMVPIRTNQKNLWYMPWCYGDWRGQYTEEQTESDESERNKR